MMICRSSYIHSNYYGYVSITTTIRRAVIMLFVFWIYAHVSLASALMHTTAHIALGSRRVYANPNYLYSVVLPEGLHAISDAPPSPNHGIRIILSDNGDDYIIVDGSYNSAYYLSPSDYIDRLYLLTLTKRGAKITNVKRHSCVLGGLPGRRVSFKYILSGDRKWAVIDIAVAFRKLPHDTEMIYSLTLSSSPAMYETDKAVFEMILSSWTCIPERSDSNSRERMKRGVSH